MEFPCFHMIRCLPVELVVFGYQAWDYRLPLRLPPVDPSFKYKDVCQVFVPEPKIVAVSLGCHFVGAINFWPDTHNADNALMGAMKRVATKMPDYDPAMVQEYLEFGFDFIVRNMQSCVLEFDCDLSVESWLSMTSYPLYRVEELLKEAYSHGIISDKDRVVSSHVKWEPYREPKYCRGIYSRSDFFKTKFGPACGEIGRRFFRLKWLIKKLSTSEKMVRMRELFDNPYLKSFTNDFTAFESTFRKHLMVLEIFFFAFCLQNRKERDELMAELKKVKFDVNKLRFKWFIIWLEAKRYSGEMDTSLSNGLQDLIMICFMLYKSGHPREFYEDLYPPQIEGDDSIGMFMYPLDESVLLKIGAKAKMMTFNNFREASFCGMVFAEDSTSILRDPISTVLDFGLCHYKYKGSSLKLKKSLIRAKSMSLIVNYPGCPIVRNLALYGLRVTAEIKNSHALNRVLKSTTDSYARESILRLMNTTFQPLADVEVTDGSRDLMETVFGVPISLQLAFESYLDSLDKLQPLDFPPLYDVIGPDRMLCFDRQTAFVAVKRNPAFEPPGRVWRKLSTLYEYLDL
jgi:hypothetical protein